jgi:tRNA-dihydrouridine synthase B
LAHLQSIYAFHGEESGLRIARKHLGWYARLLEGSPDARSRLMAAPSTSLQFACADELFGSWAMQR